MSTNLTSIKCSLYLEGIEVPFNTVSVNERVNEPPTCTVTFPPQSGALKVLPGTIVQVFGERKIPNEEVESFLIFEGEASGITLVKSADGRQAAIQAKSFTNRWKQIQKFAIDYLPQYTKQFAQYYLLNTSELNPTGTDSVEASSNAERMEHSNILGLHQYLYNAVKKYNLDEEVEGNTNVIFKELLKTFKNNSYYYALMDKALDISRTFFGFPSQSGLVYTKIATTNSQILKQMIRGTNVMTFYDLLQLFSSYFNMSLSFPSSYTYTNHAETGNKSPMRGYFVPDLTYSIPIKSNIVFPTELKSVNMSRNFDAEPTVLSSCLDRVTLSEGSESGIAAGTFVPIYISPGIQIGGDQEEKPMLSFTPEETYRGRVRSPNLDVPVFSEMYMVARSKKKLKIDGKKELEDGEKQTLKSTVDLMLKRFTDSEFLKRRYQTRVCTAETVYNPYRITGFPGLIFDYDGSPSIVGLLAAQSININSEGVATSTLTFSAPRLIWDETDFTDLIENYSNDYPLYNLTNDVFPVIPMWYDDNFYSFNNIGIEMYPYVQKGTLADIPGGVKGTLGSPTGPEGDSQWSKWKGAKTILKQLKDDGGIDYIKNIAPSPSDKTPFYDCSLLSFARNPDTGDLDTGGVRVNDKLDSIKALAVAIQAIKTLKGDFDKVRDKPFFVKTQNHRELISKEDYFKFLGITPTIDSAELVRHIPQYPNDYQDTDKIVTVQSGEEMAKADPITGKAIFEKQVPYATEKDRPFSKRRADHVIQAFKEYLEDSTLKKDSVIVTR